jgi:hypothetical protein
VNGGRFTAEGAEGAEKERGGRSQEKEKDIGKLKYNLLYIY